MAALSGVDGWGFITGGNTHQNWVYFRKIDIKNTQFGHHWYIYIDEWNIMPKINTAKVKITKFHRRHIHIIWSKTPSSPSALKEVSLFHNQELLSELFHISRVHL